MILFIWFLLKYKLYVTKTRQKTKGPAYKAPSSLRRVILSAHLHKTICRTLQAREATPSLCVQSDPGFKLHTHDVVRPWPHSGNQSPALVCLPEIKLRAQLSSHLFDETEETLIPPYLTPWKDGPLSRACWNNYSRELSLDPKQVSDSLRMEKNQCVSQTHNTSALCKTWHYLWGRAAYSGLEHLWISGFMERT